MDYRRMPIEAESPEELPGIIIRYNLAESSMHDRTLRELLSVAPGDGPVGDPLGLYDLPLKYDDHRGSLAVRSSIAAGSSGALTPDDILLCPGGAACALFIVHTTLLTRDSPALIIRPNYATNLETPFAIGARIDAYDLHHDTHFALAVDVFISRITRATRLVSITTPHNPTGAVISSRDITRIVEAMKARAHAECMLLVDETYGELLHSESEACATPPVMSAALDERVITVASLSKTYGMPGLRLGWIVCKHAGFMTRFLAAKEQLAISGSVLDERVAAHVLARRAAIMPSIRANICARKRMLLEWLLASRDVLECVVPAGGVVCFPRIRSDTGVQPLAFYARLLQEHAIVVGPGHWFEQSDAHFRLGLGWYAVEEWRTALDALTSTLRTMAAEARVSIAAGVV